MSINESIAHLYAAFNRRDIDATLVLMSEGVDWPKASEGGRVVGKQGIREYWTRQWQEFDPRVDIVDVVDRGDGTVEVKVHQLVKSLNGDVLSDSGLWHVYQIFDGLITRMDVREHEASSEGPSSSFSRK